MEYLCLVYFEPDIFGRMTPEEKEKMERDSGAYDRKLERDGQMVIARALGSVRDAVTVTVRGSKISSTDGPFAETKEYLGGFILVKAKDIEEAKAIAAGIPLAKYGKIEVRPMYRTSEA